MVKQKLVSIKKGSLFFLQKILFQWISMLYWAFVQVLQFDPYWVYVDIPILTRPCWEPEQ